MLCFVLFFMFSLVRESGSHNPPEQLLCNCECRRSPLGQLGRKRLEIVSWFSDCDSAKGQLPRRLLGKSQELGGSVGWVGMEVKSTFCLLHLSFYLLVTLFCYLLVSFPWALYSLLLSRYRKSQLWWLLPSKYPQIVFPPSNYVSPRFLTEEFSSGFWGQLAGWTNPHLSMNNWYTSYYS